MISSYYWLTKPGIIYGNLITTAGGFFLASRGNIDWLLLLYTLLGISFVIGSACVINNYFDRDIDARMSRTKNRALVTKVIPVRNAMIFAVILGAAGFFILWKYSSLMATLMGLIGFLVYVAIYSPLKRKTIHSTLIGSISGSMPLVAGYTAVTNQFDLGALLLFIIFSSWQMPHFYAIAIYRFDDYARALIPVLPARKGFKTTKAHMLVFVFIFVATSTLLTFYKYTGYFYLTVMLIVGLAWLWFVIKGFKRGIEDAVWAKKMFRFSLIVLLLFSIMISIDSV